MDAIRFVWQLSLYSYALHYTLRYCVVGINLQEGLLQSLCLSRQLRPCQQAHRCHLVTPFPTRQTLLELCRPLSQAIASCLSPSMTSVRTGAASGRLLA